MSVEYKKIEFWLIMCGSSRVHPTPNFHFHLGEVFGYKVVLVVREQQVDGGWYWCPLHLATPRGVR